VWILNSELLKDENYKLGVYDLIESEKKNGMYLEDKRIWWENVKYEIKKYSIKCSKVMRKAKNAREQGIRDSLRKETKEKEIDVQKIIELEEKLKKIEEEKCQGARLRSKAKYTVEGEKCTKFFFDLERRKGRAESIKELKNKDEECIKGTKLILNEVKTFYEELFRAEGIEEENKSYLLQHIKARVDKEDKRDCDEEIKEEEIIQAIESLKSKKSPGIDGIVNEFYKTFKKEISKILKEVYNEIFKKKELDQRMSMGLMKLIYKRKGDKKSLKNYRPITMLNGDLKILAKILSNRLKNVLPKIIETNQAYGVIGRDIADTTSSIRDIMSILKENERKGYIISLDFEKAFDRVEHDFLFAILEHFGFG
ncbi:MAG: RNA-directed DNA polymerase, partial [Mycoplasmoidaceae bacterium]